MKILKILFSCFVVLVLSVFFVFELIFSRSVDNSLSAYAEENITSDSVEPLSGEDPDPSIIDYHWDLSGFNSINLNLAEIFTISQGVLTNIGDFDIGDYTIRLVFSDYVPGAQYQLFTSPTGPAIFTEYVGSVVSFTLNVTSSLYIYVNGIVVPTYVMLVKGTYTAETMPAYQPNLKYIFTTGFTNGYRDGYDTGSDSGRDYGYNLGYISGYDTGYSYGRNSQISEGLFKNPLDVFLQPISNFLNTDIFGSFSIGDGFTIAFFVIIALIFIKMFAGG